ncbi:type-F conjugative transfer system protein TrbI [Salmonella enterica subsp. enterica serovar Richmond]|nr:type-F conjugative transfer system protein TrbI [Salmonella enterica subsp. enterica serovar Richmond]EBY6939033.1 type-F conjugative transfer system protein TrbI [Salmonella enterica subsp. enterica serovar Newport]EBZ2757960.1 type-F conjugative transfer system protein TrbI [Salmonella enterica subsp. enterica serovar Pomona]ECB7316531.1 type-F conjugative transfer system protein TrbI [Salmonella enterica subsp. enterica serovar Treforest]ECD5452740.1 type-F conjugative transfer system pro
MDDEKLNDTSTATPVSPVPDNTPEKRSSRRSRRRWRCVKPVALVISGVMVLNAAITLLLIQWQQPVTVSVDLTGTVNSFVNQAAGQQLDEAQMQALTARFHTALRASLTDWQQANRAVVLVAPAVVAGARDITTEIQTEVARRMAEGDSA